MSISANLYIFIIYMGFLGSSVGKESACNVGGPVPFMGREDPLEKGQAAHPSVLGFPGGSAGKEPACNAGTWVQYTFIIYVK